ncbi:response regulator transcription factor [Saccharothrix longispora]|uniref:response regulator transcription factor n=1 Tax=Saccharothrix longispora TaxID=33920 RepID=UPI0028FDC287|nr:response regulator transcription factor [Saccharothrix longispora]MBY8849077.1 response regulator transcription factor [Saccharothrix sp. MB29]MDU0287836.1 response regulator transcription factor [Saccharothrix longispora]
MTLPPHPSAPVRVVLVEDHRLVAEALGLAWADAVDVEVVATAGSIAAAVADVRRLLPDVVLLDRRLPDGDGLEAVGLFGEAGARVLVLTGEVTVSVAARAAECGAAGLVSKSARLDELTDAVLRVAAGEVVFDGAVLAGVLGKLTGRVPGGRGALTTREREALVLLAQGAGTEEIGERMGIARNTVRNHVQRVLEKLGARSKLEAVAIARRDGLLD